MTVDEYPCVEHANGQKCGTTWYSFTAQGHTVGVCDKAGRKFTGKVDKNKDTGQVTLLLVDSKGEAVAAVAFTPGPSA